jgi:hypothetical protein
MENYFGESIPKLGFGLMRLPKLPGGKIDVSRPSGWWTSSWRRG